MRPGRTRYTSIGDAQVAFQVTGEGPVDLVYMVGVGSNFQMWWEFPPLAAMLERLASFSRLILFDRRGSGISDVLPPGSLPTWEAYATDLGAVLDAVGSEAAAIYAAFDGGPVALAFAAMNPERVSALILWNSFARLRYAEDYPFGQREDVADEIRGSIESLWGTEDLARFLLPKYADDEAVMEWQAKVLRGACTPASYVRQNAMLTSIDARPVLPLVQAPVLVLHSAEHIIAPPELGRYVAERVPDGQFVDVPGDAMDIWDSADPTGLLNRVEEFVTGITPAVRAERALASVLFTDIVGSTEQADALGDARWRDALENHDRRVREIVGTWGGRVVKTTGDGVLATFDGPGRALLAALDLHKALRLIRIEIRAGVHFGEIELRPDGDIGGIGVHVAARVMGLAAAGSVVCTRTVKELTYGADLEFTDLGVHTLKGIADEWSLFEVRPR